MKLYFHCHFIVTYSCGFEFPSYNQSLNIRVKIVYNIRNMASVVFPTINAPRIFPNERMAKIINVSGTMNL